MLLTRHFEWNLFFSIPQILTTDFGLSVKFDGEKNAEIFLATSQPVCGLCGTNDFDPLNDQQLQHGQHVRLFILCIIDIFLGMEEF